MSKRKKFERKSDGTYDRRFSELRAALPDMPVSSANGFSEASGFIDRAVEAGYSIKGGEGDMLLELNAIASNYYENARASGVISPQITFRFSAEGGFIIFKGTNER